MGDLKITSLNVKGLNHVIKRQKTLTLLKKEKCQVALLQETHLSDQEHNKLRRNWVGQVFYSSYKSNSRGVAILLHRNLPFTLDRTISDGEGRYILVAGHIYGEHVLLGSIYAPNIYDPAFFPKLLADISGFSTSYILIGGDFNCTPNPTIDQSPPRPSPSRKSLKLAEFCTDLDLYDAWRVLHPTGRDYSFFSKPHQSFSRIDLFFSSRTLLDRINDCSIGSQTISDHSLISIIVSPPYINPSHIHWRLKPTLLNNPHFVDYINRELKQFISENKSPEISPTILWETAKAYLRGAIISYTSAQKKKALQTQLELEQKIKELEGKFKSSPSKLTEKQLDATRSALNQLLTKQAESALFFAKH